MPTLDAPMYTLDEVCALLRISRRTAFRRLATGELRGYKVAGRGGWRFERADVQRLLVARR